MLYVDEPIGVGFSYGINLVNSSVTAAPFVWTLLQAFFTSFPQYETRDFGLFTESYGGHYGPGKLRLFCTYLYYALMLTSVAFASYFESQNKAIASHQIHGHEINLVAMGINNGWYDTIIQEREFISFSVNNSYFPLINSSIAASYLSDYYSTCLPPSEKCTSTTGQNAECSAARAACGVVDDKYSVFYPNLDEYDIRQPASSPFPPQTYMTYLSDPSIMKAIGAKINYTMCSHAAGDAFHADADGTYPSACSGQAKTDTPIPGNRSFLPTLSALIQSGLRTLIWAGDADSVCDWFGGFASVNSVSWSGGDTFRAKGVVNYTVKGVVGGEYKSVENLSWLRVFESGHEVPAFQPALALQAFKQTLGGKGIFST